MAPRPGSVSVTPIEQRPALCSALASLREQDAGVLVVAKRDRVARDVVISAMVERTAAAAGARIVSSAGEGNGDTPADAFMRTVIDGASAYERALIRARTKAALAVLQARGESTGTPPFGYRLGEDGKRLEPDSVEQATLAAVRELRSSGMSYRRVRSEATARGLLSRTGRPFTLQAVYTMLEGSADERRTKVAAQAGDSVVSSTREPSMPRLRRDCRGAPCIRVEHDDGRVWPVAARDAVRPVPGRKESTT